MFHVLEDSYDKNAKKITGVRCNLYNSIVYAYVKFNNLNIKIIWDAQKFFDLLLI